MTRRPIGWIALAVVGAALAAILWTRVINPPVTHGPAKILPVALLEDVFSFHQRIGEPPYMGAENSRKDVGTFFFEARASAKDGPDGYVLRYEGGDCSPVTLPAGRMVGIDYVGPWISGASATLPMEPLAFAQARAMAEAIMNDMMAAGWTRTFHRPDLDTAGIANAMGHRQTLARLTVCGNAGTYASVVVRSYGDGSPGFSVPPMAVGPPRPENAPTRYLVRVQILARNFSRDTANLIDGYEQAVRTKREKVTGDGLVPAPLSVWRDKRAPQP